MPGIPGVRAIGSLPEDARTLRIAGAMAVAPEGSVLAGWAAAAVHGVPADFLDGTDGRRDLPVDICVPSSRGDWQHEGIRLRRSAVGRTHRTEVDGLAVTSPARTALDLARWTRQPGRRLAMLDLSVRHGLIEPAAFKAFLDPLGGLHGLRAVREVVPLVSRRAESVPESELRWLWHEAGLPTPLVNPRIFDRFGNLVGRADLLDPESGLVAEYQGFWHLLDGAEESDAWRAARFGRMNLTVVEIWKKDVQEGTVRHKLREGHLRALARDTRLDAWVCREGD